jgi:hypothetical protein
MKKLLLGAILLIASIFSYGQEVKIPDSSKLTVSKVYDDVKTGLSGLAAGLKVGVEHVYVVLVKQQVVYAVTWLIVVILILVLGGIVNYKYFKAWERICDGDNEPSIILIIMLDLIILSLVFCNINSIIGGFINPEYGAIKEIVDFVK